MKYGDNVHPREAMQDLSAANPTLTHTQLATEPISSYVSACERTRMDTF